MQPFSLPSQSSSLQDSRQARCRISTSIGIQAHELCSSLRRHLQGFDVSQAMLDVAADREVEGDLCLQDLGQGMPLRAGVFDGAISISAIQWLCNAARSLAHPAWAHSCITAVCVRHQMGALSEAHNSAQYQHAQAQRILWGSP